MKRFRKILLAVLAIYIAAAALSLPAKSSPPAPRDSVRVTLSGGLKYENLGELTSGDIVVTTGSFGGVDLQGGGTLPGKAGGLATITFNVRGFFGLGLGSVRVTDPGVGLDASMPIFLQPLHREPPARIFGSTSWFTPGWRPGQELFTRLDWVVNDEA